MKHELMCKLWWKICLERKKEEESQSKVYLM